MAGGINVQASDGKYVNINFEAGAADNVSMTVPKEGGKVVVTDSSGNVGIGTTTPSKQLHIKATTSTVAQIESTTTTSFVGIQNANAQVFVGTQSDGSFAIQTSGSSYSNKLVVDAAGTATISTAGQGLKLPNAASTDATTLDWYEEGTFTPTIIGTTTVGTGTYSVNKGKFTRIGNKVHIEVGITVTAHTGTGSMRITGIPFTISADSGYAATSLVDYANLTITGIPYVVAAPGASSIWLIAMGTSGGTPIGLAMDTSFVLAFSMTYSV